MQHARLDDGQRPRVPHRFGEALESVAHDDADVLDTAVLDLGKHYENLAPSPPLPTHKPEDGAFPVDGHTNR
jgi:hypothetical protein